MSLTPQDAEDIVAGHHGDPFSVLGLHEVAGKWVVRAFVPGAQNIEAIDPKSGRRIAALTPVDIAPGLFEGIATRRRKRFAYHLRVMRDGHQWVADDPYRFGPVMGALDEYLIGEGTHQQLWRALGAHLMTHEGVEGTHFAVWAPNAAQLLVGAFADQIFVQSAHNRPKSV
ncbi:MAG: 1,4-alpha-glucan branching enzyme, partial [Pseudomonadota bacterium]